MDGGSDLRPASPMMIYTRKKRIHAPGGNLRPDSPVYRPFQKYVIAREAVLGRWGG